MNPVTALPRPTTHPARSARARSRAEHIAHYYGFVSIDELQIDKEDRTRARSVAQHIGPFPYARVEDKIALLRRYEKERTEYLTEPALVYREEARRARDAFMVHLDILGTGQSIAEAILIKTAIEILRAAGAGDLLLRVNSVGDRESFGRFTRELGLFYRKKIDELHASCRAALKDDLLSLLACAHEPCAAIRAEAPEPVGFLSDAARGHFKEVLEYLEALEVPYALARHLVGPAGLCSHTVFDIRDGGGALLASGFRYNHLARRAGFRRDIPALGATLALAGPLACLARRAKAQAPARFYFVQLGNAAKRRSLHIIELLRRAEIPLAQSIASEKLSTQIARAEALGTPYLIMVGQKEALEGTAMVRDRERSFQETVPLTHLASFLARLRA